MRFIPALAGALLITVAVFMFMQGLIEGGRDEAVELPVYSDVTVFRQEREQEEPEPEDEAPQQPTEEPAMGALDIAEVSPPTPKPATNLELPALELDVGDINIQAVGDSWSGPLAAGAVSIGGGGTDAQGFVEVIPFNTRKPNVPEVAWQNKVNGWVLVAFSVSPEGKTRNVRVLDANPRGVFEEKVVAAVEDWLYSVKFYGKGRSDVILTQKVEVRWESYPQNLPNVD
jgi:periplasmic protein TonB